MENNAAISAFKALAQESRLEVFKLLVKAEPQGLSASAVSRELGIFPSTLSGHLAILHNAGLVASRRDGREIIYTARLARVGAVVDFLLVDCCDGHDACCTAQIPRARLAES